MDSIIGKKLDGRYEITELIGVGGMADVYKANDVMENRTVAVKILKPEFSENEEFVRRFRNESKAIAVLSHPNIVKIYDVGFTDEIQFIVMEYIDGITLKELIEQQGVLRWKDALKFVVQILKALQHAHDKGIVHRDIKPQNIMLFPDGTIKVMDFGIARFSRIDGKTLSDKTIGSVHYISPEQAKGEMTDERSDIYSVGVMLYEMLTGRKPFDGENPVAIAVKHMQETPVPPREIMPSIPESLEEIVLHAMERSPSRRYQSAAEMINDISAFKVNPSIVFGYKNSPAPASDEDAASTRFFKPVSGDSYDDEEDYDEDYDDYDDDYDDRYQEKQRSYVVPILLAVTVAVVIIAAIVVAYSVINSFNPTKTHSTNVNVQNFVGLNFQRVRQEYSEKINFQVKEEWSNEYQEGVIIEQDITNKSVREGTTVNVVVSKGPRMVEVPNLVGKSENVALSELRGAGFSPNVKSIYDDKMQTGYVVKTEPQAGSQYAAGAEIDVFISKGQMELEVKMPDVIGMTREKAMQTIKEAKLNPIVVEVKQEGNKGKVVEQQFSEGTFLARGKEVTIYVSTGEVDPIELKLPVPIPNGASGKYILTIYRDGTLDGTQVIDEGEVVAGSKVNVKVTGNKSETIAIGVRSEKLGKSVTKYISFEVDYEKGEIKVTSGPDTKSFPVTSTTTTTTTKATTPASSEIEKEKPADNQGENNNPGGNNNQGENNNQGGNNQNQD